ncbi:MAG: Crp/Fnr family transcriptional regulator [Luteibaculaceae bacterium]
MLSNLELELVKAKFPNLEPALYDEIKAHGFIKEFKADDILMEPGQYFKSNMMVLEGHIKVFREDLDGGEYFMYYIKESEACALSMVCALKQESSEVLGKAVTDLKVLSIPLDKMDLWVRNYRTWYYFVLETYRTRFEEMLQTLDQIAFKSLDERLEFYLKRNAKAMGDKLNVTHQSIANELNSSREVISRLLKKLEQKGVIKLNRNEIEIINL